VQHSATSFVLKGPSLSGKTKAGVSSPHVNEPVYETPPTPGYHELVVVTIILILFVRGAAKNLVESVVILILKGLKSSDTRLNISTICASVKPEGAHDKGAPPFHEVDCTYCPSKSRKMVACAEGKLLNMGRQLDLVENKMSNGINIAKSFFMAEGF